MIDIMNFMIKPFYSKIIQLQFFLPPHGLENKVVDNCLDDIPKVKIN